MERIYHHYKMWEDYTAGFYNNCTGKEKEIYSNYVFEMFNNEALTIEYMKKVIFEWVYSCEHNLTNPSLNKIAYIGQGACCLYKGIPSTVTMEVWSKLSDDVKNRANKQAESVLNLWLDNNKNIQLCLNIF